MTCLLTFDNLDELAAEQFLPRMEAALAEHGVRATFFCEGRNLEERPDVLRRLEDAGHEVAYHAWAHETWGELSIEEQEKNLARGRAAAEEAGLRLAGFRPPGGALSEEGLALLGEHGFTYASPAGVERDRRHGVALLPFAWPDVDAYCCLEQFAHLREDNGDPAEGVSPEQHEKRILARVEQESVPIFHALLIDWFTEQRLRTVLGAIGEHQLCREAAE